MRYYRDIFLVTLVIVANSKQTNEHSNDESYDPVLIQAKNHHIDLKLYFYTRKCLCNISFLSPEVGYGVRISAGILASITAKLISKNIQIDAQ
jgi:hypothetical protein